MWKAHLSFSLATANLGEYGIAFFNGSSTFVFNSTRHIKVGLVILFTLGDTDRQSSNFGINVVMEMVLLKIFPVCGENVMRYHTS